jgi:glycosyltransferase involved in cell wall biosynthesis
MNHSITIAIPFYRDLEYLRVAVESALAQERSDWRMIVCDDGAVEQGALELVTSFCDDRITYRRSSSHLGMVHNWNRCLDDAPSPFVTLLHADDRLLPNYVDVVLGLAERHPEAMAYFCGTAIIDAAGHRQYSTADTVKRFFIPNAGREIVLRGEPAVKALMAGNFIMCPTLSFRKPLLGEERFSDRWQQVQDLELTTRLLMGGALIVGSREVAYEYRRHSAAATALQSTTFLRFDEEFALFDEVAERTDRLGWHDAARVARGKRIVKLHLLYRFIGELARLHPTRAFANLRYLLARRSAVESE